MGKPLVEAIKKPSDASILVDSIEKFIKSEADRIFQEEKQVLVRKLTERLDREKEKIIASVAVRLSHMFQVETLQDRVVLTIQTKSIIEEKKKRA